MLHKFLLVENFNKPDYKADFERVQVYATFNVSHLETNAHLQSPNTPTGNHFEAPKPWIVSNYVKMDRQ